jgi:WD40 repeat protein
VRCLALDSGLLASGCSDHLIRVWLPVGGKVQEYSNGGRRSSSGAVSDSGSSNGVSTGGEADGEPLDDPLSLVDDTIAPVVAAPAPGRSAGASSCACLFDLSQPASHVLSGHRGPVDALCLSEHALYSGSWDYR